MTEGAPIDPETGRGRRVTGRRLIDPTRGRGRYLAALVVVLLFGGPAAAPAADEGPDAPTVRHGPKGWELETADGNWLLRLDARLQFRIAYPGDTDPVTNDDFRDQDEIILKVNRARLKVGGHAHAPWLKYYWEYELASSNLLDFRLMVTRHPFLQLKVGQWKVQYNRERVISSGEQQLADRSHINRPFTVDRQQGVSLYGTLAGPGIALFNYWASVFTGMGRGARGNDDLNLMWMGRIQWGFLGRPVPFSGSDLERRDSPAGILAIAAVTNRSPYTRFSQDGGGQLEGFEDGEPGQYRVNQAQLETAFLYRGFAWQQELHWKEIDDRKNAEITTLTGYYVQLGSFLHTWIAAVPEPIELAFRYAAYDPDREIERDRQIEYTLAVNVFLAGHRNKVTAEVSLFDFEEVPEHTVDGERIRLQWDFSI